MTLKPPTRTLPKLVMKEWPEKNGWREKIRVYQAAMKEIKLCENLLMWDERYHKLLLMNLVIEEYSSSEDTKPSPTSPE